MINSLKNKMIEIEDSDTEILLVKISRPAGKVLTSSVNRKQLQEYVNERIKNGYVISESQIIREKGTGILAELAKISRQFLDKNSVLLVRPTEEAKKEVENILSQLALAGQNISLTEFNDRLFKLFSIIPRNMKKSILQTAKSKDDYTKIIERELSLLDGLENVSTDEQSVDADIAVKEIHDYEFELIRKLCGSVAPKRIWEVSNMKQERKFAKYVSDNSVKHTSLLFHGSRNENWYSIIKTGLKVNPVNVIITGKMFGNGIYFAPKAKKSLGYSSVKNAKYTNENSNRGYLALYEVATEAFDVYEWEQKYTSISQKNFKKEHSDKTCLYAHKGISLLEDEVIIYDEAACKIKYLIEI